MSKKGVEKQETNNLVVSSEGEVAETNQVAETGSESNVSTEESPTIEQKIPVTEESQNIEQELSATEDQALTQIKKEASSSKKAESQSSNNHIPSDDEVYDPKLEKKSKKPKKLLTEEERKKRKRKKIIIISIIILLLLAGTAVFCYFMFFMPKPAENKVESATESTPEKPKIYSKLTGLEISDASINSMPTYCIQIPNGLDGARPQTGLSDAAVIFEAIAEAGITRFAAIYQNPEGSVIGPIRSLRSYYLDWDTPFDCTVVHAGGSDEATLDLATGNYRDLNESAVYMWRDKNSYWAPNNLMTSPNLLAEFNSSMSYTTSTPSVFPRLTPDEAEKAVQDTREKAGKNTSDSSTSDTQNTEDAESSTPFTPLITDIEVNFGYVPSFNVHYKYDENTNSYLRSYANGQEHISYSCPAGLNQPDPKSECGAAKQVSPKVVIAMMVDEYLASDNYHQVIQTIGSGNAYIFQNGTAEKGTWVKNNKHDQITFKDSAGNIISFTPGQIIISALPNSTGSVKY
ncbi:DUF3048 domain-containing protein [Candidatus Saccharibacteria bacterium]|nr:DUF3048 domain-containing protein [Candidatus Saccharibacteria bacterium]